MIFYLSSLPNQSFDVLKQVYYAELKSQSVPRSKKGTIGKHLDLKGSQFKCLRGLEVPEVHRLLIELNSKISLKEMGNECATIKQMQKVQVAFIRGTNCKNWDEPCERFPLFTTAEQLEPFKKLNFSGKTLPRSSVNVLLLLQLMEMTYQPKKTRSRIIFSVYAIKTLLHYFGEKRYS